MAPRSASPLFSTLLIKQMSDLDFRKEFRRGDTLGVEVLMRKFLTLAVMCSLAFPAMALGQEVRAEEGMEELEMAEEAQETAEETAEEAAEGAEGSEKLVTPVQKPEGVPVPPKA